MLPGQNFFKGQLKHFILSALSKQPMHGYLLMQAIQEQTMNLWKPASGALYPALEELKNEGMIEVKEQSKTGRKKKIYSITPEGKKRFTLLDSHVKEIKDSMVKACRENPEFSKFLPEDSLFLSKMIHNALNKKLSKFRTTLLEYATLARTGKLKKEQLNKGLKAFHEFLEKIQEINELAKKSN